jgi:Protein of unknown function (DUF3179)
MRSVQKAVTVLLTIAPLLVGFDLSRHSIPPEEILAGGPPKDGIPALTEPRFVDADSTTFLRPDDRVIGLVQGGVAKAYPLRILNWHEVVNDAIGTTPVAVTYCPLTGSGVVYDRTANGRTHWFGVSGLLYQSNVLFYDHETESLWSQLQEEAVAGPLTGTRLRAVPSVTTTWVDWRHLHPDTLVLSTETGYRRDYEGDPYARYRVSPEVMFPLRRVDSRLPAKEKVLGVQVGSVSKAYPLNRLAQARRVEDQLRETPIRIDYDPDAQRAVVSALNSNAPMPAVTAYWFAWSAFHPDTALWGGEIASTPQPPSPHAGAPSGKAESSDQVAVEGHSAYWSDALGRILAGIGGGNRTDTAPLLVIRGDLRNTSGHTLGHVKLVYELLDANGRVVAQESGYNRGGEALRPTDATLPAELRGQERVAPIPKNGTDTFRMFFLRDDVPPFETYRIRVVEAVAVSD